MTDVAFLGLGVMGSRMAARLSAAGHRLTVWNRTAGRAEAFAAAHGASVAASPAQAAAAATTVLTVLDDALSVEQVLLDAGGAAAGARPGTLFIDCTTMAPQHARAIGSALGVAGHAFVDAPVTGSPARAAAGMLTIHAGGQPEALARAVPILEPLGTVAIAGPPGQGQVATMLACAVAVAVAGEAAGSLAARHDPAAVLHLDRMLADARGCAYRSVTADPALPGVSAGSHPADEFAAMLALLTGPARTPR